MNDSSPMRQESSFAGVDWSNDASVCGFVQQAMLWREEDLGEMMAQAQMNIYWYLGYQDCYWDPQDQAMVQAANPYGRVRLVFNQIYPAIETLLAKLARPIPLRVKPATDDRSDREAAELDDLVLRYHQRRLKLDALRAEIDLWAVLTGGVFTKVTWDPTAGEPLNIDPRELGMTQAEYRRMFPRLQDGRQGEVRVDVLSPFHVYWGPRAHAFKQADWAIEVHERSRLEVAERYGIPLEEIPCTYRSDATVYRPTATGPTGSPTASGDQDLVRVTVLWVRKTGRYHPQGRHFVILNDEKVVKRGSNPYRHGQIPLAYWPYRLAPGATCGSTPVSQCLDPQSDINKTVSDFAENCELLANPRTFVEENGIVDWSEMNNRIGGIVRVRRGFTPPTTVANVPMPAIALRRIETAIRFIQDLIGARDISQGRLPSSQVRSGVAIEALSEPDDVRAAQSLKGREELLVRTAELLLDTEAQFASEERIASVLGDDAKWRARKYSGEQLRRSRRSAYDIVIDADGAVRSRSATIALLTMLLQNRALDPVNRPDDRRWLMETLELGYAEPRHSPEAAASEAQRAEIERMRSGESVEVQVYENHDAHLYELLKHLNDPALQNDPPEFRERLAQHWVYHLSARARRAALEQGLTARVAGDMERAMNPALTAPRRMNGQPIAAAG